MELTEKDAYYIVNGRAEKKRGMIAMAWIIGLAFPIILLCGFAGLIDGVLSFALMIVSFIFITRMAKRWNRCDREQARLLLQEWQTKQTQ